MAHSDLKTTSASWRNMSLELHMTHAEAKDLRDELTTKMRRARRTGGRQVAAIQTEHGRLLITIDETLENITHGRTKQ